MRADANDDTSFIIMSKIKLMMIIMRQLEEKRW